MPDKDLTKILARIESLGEDPRQSGCKKLSGQEKYRLRYGRYRIIFSIQDKELSIWMVKVVHRKNVYSWSGPKKNRPAGLLFMHVWYVLTEIDPYNIYEPAHAGHEKVKGGLEIELWLTVKNTFKIWFTISTWKRSARPFFKCLERLMIDIVHGEKTQRYRYKSKQFSVQNLIKDDARTKPLRGSNPAQSKQWIRFPFRL